MAIFSIVEAANANSLDPRKYLQYLLDKRSDSEMTDEEYVQSSKFRSKVLEKAVIEPKLTAQEWQTQYSHCVRSGRSSGTESELLHQVHQQDHRH